MHKRLLAFAASGMLLAGLALSGARARAQEPSGPPEGGRMGHGQMMNPDAMTARLSQTLNLTDDQKGQVKTILEDRQQKMQSLRSDSTLSEPDRRSKMHSIMQESNDKIRALLNDDQKQKFDQMQKRGHERMHNPNSNPNPGGEANP
jgi:periplasmic protein CpxP/Spy